MIITPSRMGDKGRQLLLGYFQDITCVDTVKAIYVPISWQAQMISKLDRRA